MTICTGSFIYVLNLSVQKEYCTIKFSENVFGTAADLIVYASLGKAQMY